MKPLFFINVKVFNESNRFYTDKANWLRLKLYLEPFQNIQLVCEKSDKKDESWIEIPSSVQCKLYKKVNFFNNRKISISLDFFKLFFFSFSKSRKASFIGLLVSGPPFFHVALFSSLLFKKKIFSIFIGSITNSYIYVNGKQKHSKLFLRVKAKISNFLEELVLKKSETVLSAGNTLSKFEIKAKNFIKFSTSTLLAKEIRGYFKNDFSQSEKILWIYTGVLNKEKGVDLLLMSLKKIRELDKRHTAILIGREDTSFDINTFLNTNGLNEYVTLTGQIPHEIVIDYLKRADVFVFLSLHEGMPKSPLEAMAFGVPVVVTATGAEYFVENGINGMLVYKHNEDEVIKQIDKLFSNEEFRLKLINNAKLTAVKQSYDNQMLRIHEFLIKHYPHLTSISKKDWIN